MSWSGFVALPLSMPASVLEAIAPAAAAVAGASDICLQIKRGAVQVSVNWPCGDAAACAAWLREVLAQPQDMRAGAERLLAQVVLVFGQARAHHAYLFANSRATRLKLLMHDGFGVWCATQRLNQGRFLWPTAEIPLL